MLKIDLRDTETVGNTTTKRYRIAKQGRKMMDFTDIQKIFNKAKKELKGGTRFKIVGIAKNGWRTLKGYNEDEVDWNDIEEYYINKVKEYGDFTKYFVVHLIITDKPLKRN